MDGRNLGYEGTGAGSLEALRETARIHAEVPGGALAKFGNGESFDAGQARFELAELKVTDEDFPRVDELGDYLATVD